MDWTLLIKAFILGVIEGITEFLPISSTGHLIVAANLINFQSKGKFFEIAIQLGAITAVIFEHRQRFYSMTTGFLKEKTEQTFILNIIIAFIPAACLGLLFIDLIKEYFFNPITVAVMLIFGGLVIFWSERRTHIVKTTAIDQIRWQDALKIGIAQVASLIPGTSRSGATIIGALFIGFDRKLAAEFSFFLAIPTMFAATFYQLFKNFEHFDVEDLSVFAVGLISAFISALLAVRVLVRYVASHSYEIFAWYRIIFGILILVSWQFNLIDWGND